MSGKPPPYAGDVVRAVRRLGVVPTEGVYVYCGDMEWVHEHAGARRREELAVCGWWPEEGEWPDPKKYFWPVTGAEVYVVCQASCDWRQAMAVTEAVYAAEPLLVVTVGGWCDWAPVLAAGGNVARSVREAAWRWLGDGGLQETGR